MTSLVCFTMDNLSDAADLGRGVITQPRKPGQRPALEKGFPAMLDLYRKYETTITHFVEGWNGEAHPEEIQTLLKHGHELGMHGWQHEDWSELDEESAFALAEKATLALEQASGIRPVAFRAPGGRRTSFTTRILVELGYRIDASLDPSGAEGGPVKQLAENLWTVPYEWMAIDASHWLWAELSCEEVETLWLDALVAATETDKFISFIWHPHIMGIDKDRLAVGEKILKFVSQDSRFQATTLAGLVEHHRNL